jgi:hypothetical protein
MHRRMTTALQVHGLRYTPDRGHTLPWAAGLELSEEPPRVAVARLQRRPKFQELAPNEIAAKRAPGTRLTGKQEQDDGKRDDPGRAHTGG